MTSDVPLLHLRKQYNTIHYKSGNRAMYHCVMLLSVILFDHTVVGYLSKYPFLNLLFIVYNCGNEHSVLPVQKN